MNPDTCGAIFVLSVVAISQAYFWFRIWLAS